MAYDAVLVLGGGVRAGGELPEWVRARFDLALEHWRGEYLIALSAGTTHKPPPLDGQGFPIFEASAGARYLIERSVPAGRILVEACSYDTIGNAYFSRVVHCEPAGLRRLLVITSAFHMPRSRAIFHWVYGLNAPTPPYTLDFLSAPDTGIPLAALEARRAKEAESLAGLPALIQTLDGLDKLHAWLFSQHAAYRSQGAERSTTPGETY